jgi:outer membrane protein assembly factor BamD
MSVSRFFSRSALLLFTSGILTFSGCSSTKPPTTATEHVNEAYAKAKALYAKKDYSAAAVTLETLIFTSRATAIEGDILFLLAQSYYYSEQYYLAGDTYTKLLRQMPSSPFARTAQFMVGKSYEQLSPHYELDQQTTAKAIEQYKVYIEQYPVKDSLRISGEVDTYRELLKINPQNPSYKENYTRAMSQYARIDSVRYAFKAISRMRDKLARNAFSVAHQYVQLGKYKAAAIFYDEVIKKYSDSSYLHQSWTGKIDVLIKRKKWFDASQTLELYIQLYPAREKEMAGVKAKIAQNLKKS